MSLGSWRRGVDASAGRPSALAVVGGGRGESARVAAPLASAVQRPTGRGAGGETVTVAVTVTARRGEGREGCGARGGAAPRGRAGGGRRGRVGEGGRRRRREGCVRGSLERADAGAPRIVAEPRGARRRSRASRGRRLQRMCSASIALLPRQSAAGTHAGAGALGPRWRGEDGWRVAERRRWESPGRRERRGRGRGPGEGREVAGGGRCGSHRAAPAAPTGGDRSPGPPGGTPRQSRRRFFGRRLGPHRRRQRPSAQRLRRRGPAPRDDNALRSGESHRHSRRSAARQRRLADERRPRQPPPPHAAPPKLLLTRPARRRMPSKDVDSDGGGGGVEEAAGRRRRR